MPAKRFRVDAADLVVPDTAWPTVFVFLGGILAFATPVLLYWQYGVQTWWTVLLSSAAIFVLFTPMHDAAHRAVSQKHRWLNEAIGWVCALVFEAGLPAFRYVHLQHHKHTNDPQRDPDYWSGERPILLAPLRWGLQGLHYYIPFVKAARAGLVPRHLARISYTIPLFLLAFLIATIWQGYGMELLRLWVVPEKVASSLLAYTFDYIPHRPHQTQRREDIYKCTSKLGVDAGMRLPPELVDGILSTNGVDLSIPLLYQTYHNVHHLYPQIPFYRYIVIWQKYHKEFIKYGTPVVPVYSSSTPWT